MPSDTALPPIPPKTQFGKGKCPGLLRKIPSGGEVKPLSAHSLGRVLRRLRVKKGFSVESVAFAAGVSQRTICSIEGGRSNPRLSTLVCIAEALLEDLPVIFAASMGADSLWLPIS